ncbi:hypothetical protein BBJ29_004986 [Phytophthora kernoviae]|uniref:PH domain-containing protein n=1 Tax=Phytophthora kernoviae TaxID=325452 RepID=A0A3R7HE64_9STRA|nr:hypothetical protein BBJ29_004986 [Phytophthora kernoviae]
MTSQIEGEGQRQLSLEKERENFIQETASLEEMIKQLDQQAAGEIESPEVVRSVELVKRTTELEKEVTEIIAENDELQTARVKIEESLDAVQKELDEYGDLDVGPNEQYEIKFFSPAFLGSMIHRGSIDTRAEDARERLLGKIKSQQDHLEEEIKMEADRATFVESEIYQFQTQMDVAAAAVKREDEFISGERPPQVIFLENKIALLRKNLRETVAGIAKATGSGDQQQADNLSLRRADLKDDLKTALYEMRRMESELKVFFDVDEGKTIAVKHALDDDTDTVDIDEAPHERLSESSRLQNKLARLQTQLHDTVVQLAKAASEKDEMRKSELSKRRLQLKDEMKVVQDQFQALTNGTLNAIKGKDSGLLRKHPTHSNEKGTFGNMSLRGVRERWCTIESDGFLRYYKREGDRESRGAIPLNHKSLEILHGKQVGKPNEFMICSSTHQTRLAAKTRDEMLRWVKMLELSHSYFMQQAAAGHGSTDGHRQESISPSAGSAENAASADEMDPELATYFLGIFVIGRGGQRANSAEMFRARKFVEVPSKRSNGLLAPLSSDLLTASKRQRLEHWDALYAPRTGSVGDAEETSALLVETRNCTIAEGASLPPQVLEELRKEWATLPPHQRRQVRCCRASVPSARHRSGRQWVPYFVIPLRTKLLLWQQERGKVIALPLPDELETDEVLYPFLFALYSQSLSLMVVGKSGIVLFWEDIELPYESVPLSVQIPLAANEQVSTHPSAAMLIEGVQDEDMQPENDATGLLCWSNQGNVWEVAVEDRRIRVRAFEKQSAGFLSGITKSVSQFFFSSTASRSGADGGELDVNQGIKYLRVLPSSLGDAVSMSSSGGDVDETSDMLVLFQDGMLERRTFSTGDVMDCSCVSLWHFDATRVAISYFSDNFPDAHLAKVYVVSMPYVQETCFALLVAFVCSSSQGHTGAKVKYALFQFSLGSVDDDAPPELEWACMLDYESAFDEHGDSNRYFKVESFAITRGALYLVWTQAQPVQFSTILLPQVGQTSVRSAAFPLQGAQGRVALAFGPRVDQSSFDNNAVKGSVSFLLMDEALKSVGGSVCVATSSDMLKLERLAAPPPSEAAVERTRKRREDASYYTSESSHFLGENLNVEDYIRLILTHFQDDPNSASALRMSAKDVSSVAQAAVAVDIQILDAKPSSGLRWEKEGNDGALALEDSQKSDTDMSSVTPKLVRYQLEEKRNRHATFMEFLRRRCATVWDFIENSSDLKRYLTENEEKLQAAIALSKFQSSIQSSGSGDGETSSDVQRIQRRLTGKFLLHAIEKTVEKRGYQKEQLRLAGYNSFDVFYCEVSKIAELFQLLGDEVQNLATSIGESDPTYLYALLESGCSMLSMLCTPVQSTIASFSPTGSWAFTREVREVIANQIARLSVLVGYSQSSSPDKQIRWEYDEVFELTDQIQRLGSVLLDCYARFFPLASSDEVDDLRKEETFTKRVTLNPLVHIATQSTYAESSISVDFDDEGIVTRKRADLFSQCVQLCEKYSYFEGMVFLIFVEDGENLAKLDCVLGKLPKSPASKRLESYCKKYEGFDDFIFRWYNGEVRNPWGRQDSDATMMAYLLAHSQMFAPSLHKFMKTREHLTKYRWLTAIAIQRYDQVATLALHEAKSEHRSLPKRKTMASIAKIGALAAPSMAHPERIQEINHELIRGKLQELLLQLPLKESIDTQPLAPEELVRVCLDSSLSIAKDDPLRTNLFLMALEALETLVTDPLTEEYEEIRAGVWRACIVDEEDLWDNLAAESAAGVNEEKLESMMRETLLFSAMKEYASRHDHAVHSDPSSAGMTIEMIRELVHREGNADSVVGVQSQQLLIKTLHLALQ